MIGVSRVVTSLPRTGSKHRAALRPLQLVGVVRPGRAIAKRNPIGPLFSRLLLHTRLLLVDGNHGSLLTVMEVANDPHRLIRNEDKYRLPDLLDFVQSRLQFRHEAASCSGGTKMVVLVLSQGAWARSVAVKTNVPS